MNANNYFKKALSHQIKTLNIKQKTIADALNIQTTQISGYLKDKRGFSEDRKESISEYFGMTYFEMLELGKKLCEEGNSENSSLLESTDEKSEIAESADPKKDIIKYDSDYIIRKYEYLIETLTNEVDRKTEDIKSLKKEIEDYKKDVEDYKGFLKDYREGIKKFKEENENLVREISELKTQLQGSGKKEAS